MTRSGIRTCGDQHCDGSNLGCGDATPLRHNRIPHLRFSHFNVGRVLRRIRFSRTLAAALLVLGGWFGAPTANALIPYVYLPTEEELKGSSIGIGRTAAQLLQLGQAKDAARLAALAVRLNPNDERFWSILAEAQLRNNDLKDASRSLARAKQLNPEKAGLWFAEAAIALRAERPDDAVPLIARGLQLDPNNAAAYFDLGNARIMQDELPRALESFEKATALKPEFWEALNNQALVLYELGQRQEAVRRWRQVLKLEANPEPMLALAAALHQLGKQTEAIQLASTALAKNPNYVLPLHQAEQLWGRRIREATAQLLSEPELTNSVERAQANATWKKSQ